MKAISALYFFFCLSSYTHFTSSFLATVKDRTELMLILYKVKTGHFTLESSLFIGLHSDL